jgi:hypothetical protein
MPGKPQSIGTARDGGPRSKGLRAAVSTRRLAARAARPGTPGLIAPGLIAPGPGLCLSRLQERQWHFSGNAALADSAQFATNLLRAGVADPTTGTPHETSATSCSGQSNVSSATAPLRSTSHSMLPSASGPPRRVGVHLRRSTRRESYSRLASPILSRGSTSCPRSIC